MMDIEQFKAATVGNVIGYGFHAGFGTGGECGELASYWFSELTNNQYQFAYGKPGINASWAIGSDCATAWNVAYQSDWNAMGFEKIDNPSASQLKKGDIFFISARSGLLTGHVGVVYSTDNNNIVTIEQNYSGARYTKYMPGDNSWSYYGGFSCVVRPIEQKTETTKPQEGNNKKQKASEQMIYINTEKNNYLVTNDGYYTWISNEADNKSFKAFLPGVKMKDADMRNMFINIKDKKK